MQLIRTTLRLRTDLKKEAERRALEENVSLQEVFNRALQEYLTNAAKKKAKLIFRSFKLGVPLDNLTRDDIYPDPK